MDKLLSLQRREMFATFPENFLQHYAQHLALMLEIYNSLQDPFRERLIRSVSQILLVDVRDQYTIEFPVLSDEITFRLLSIKDFPHLNDGRGVDIINAMAHLLKALQSHINGCPHHLNEYFINHRLNQIARLSIEQIDRSHNIYIDPPN